MIELGAIAALDKRTKKGLRDGSHYGWLNVLYEMDADVVQELMQMWQRDPEVKSDLNGLSLTASERTVLADLVNSLEAGSVIVGFADEAASLFVFGSDSTLSQLIEAHRRVAQK